MSEPDKDPQLVMLEQVLNRLSEHFDSIQIIATDHKGSHTVIIQSGVGNMYSRIGAVAEWLECQRIRVRVHTKKQIRDEEEEK